MKAQLYNSYARGRYQIYSLDPTIDLFIGPYRVLYKEGLSAFIAGIGSFQTAKFEIDSWQQFQLACFQKLPKVETFTKLPQFLSSTIVLHLFACFQK